MCRIIVNPHPKCAILSEQTARMVIETFHALTYTLAKYDATNEIFFTFNLYLMFLTRFSKNSFLDFQKKNDAEHGGFQQVCIRLKRML